MKQFSPWQVRQLDGGILEWTSPLGVVYIDRPPLPVTFVPEWEPPSAAGCGDEDRSTGSGLCADPPDREGVPF
jgi:hypothetical protein